MNYDDDELQGCTVDERAKANARQAAVSIWQWSLDLGAARGIRASRVNLEVLRLLESIQSKVSIKTLYAWRRAYRDKGIVGLVDLRGRDDRPRYRKFFLELARIYESQFVTGAMAHELTRMEASKQGWQIPTVRESKQYIKANIRPGVTTERGANFEGHSDGASNGI